MEKPLTSEEKLLNIIRKKKTPQSTPEGKGQPRDDKSQGALAGPSKNKNEINPFKTVNRILFFIIPILVVLLCVEYYIVKQKSDLQAQQALVRAAKEEKEASRKTDTAPGVDKPMDVYLSRFGERDIFMAPWEKPQDQNSAATAIAPLSEELKVTGIVLDNNPQAIVEDVKTEQTYFLSTGDTVKNAKVLEIKEDRVIFEYNNSKVELVQ